MTENGNNRNELTRIVEAAAAVIAVESANELRQKLQRARERDKEASPVQPPSPPRIDFSAPPPSSAPPLRPDLPPAPQPPPAPSPSRPSYRPTDRPYEPRYDSPAGPDIPVTDDYDADDRSDWYIDSDRGYDEPHSEFQFDQFFRGGDSVLYISERGTKTVTISGVHESDQEGVLYDIEYPSELQPQLIPAGADVAVRNGDIVNSGNLLFTSTEKKKVKEGKDDPDEREERVERRFVAPHDALVSIETVGGNRWLRLTAKETVPQSLLRAENPKNELPIVLKCIEQLARNYQQSRDSNSSSVIKELRSAYGYLQGEKKIFSTAFSGRGGRRPARDAHMASVFLKRAEQKADDTDMESYFQEVENRLKGYRKELNEITERRAYAIKKGLAGAAEWVGAGVSWLTSQTLGRGWRFIWNQKGRILIAALLAGVGYGGYKGFKWLTRDIPVQSRTYTPYPASGPAPVPETKGKSEKTPPPTATHGRVVASPAPAVPTAEPVVEPEPAVVESESVPAESPVPPAINKEDAPRPAKKSVVKPAPAAVETQPAEEKSELRIALDNAIAKLRKLPNVGHHVDEDFMKPPASGASDNELRAYYKNQLQPWLRDVVPKLTSRQSEARTAKEVDVLRNAITTEEAKERAEADKARAERARAEAPAPRESVKPAPEKEKSPAPARYSPGNIYNDPAAKKNYNSTELKQFDRALHFFQLKADEYRRIASLLKTGLPSASSADTPLITELITFAEQQAVDNDARGQAMRAYAKSGEDVEDAPGMEAVAVLGSARPAEHRFVRAAVDSEMSRALPAVNVSYKRFLPGRGTESEGLKQEGSIEIDGALLKVSRGATEVTVSIPEGVEVISVRGSAVKVKFGDTEATGAVVIDASRNLQFSYQSGDKTKQRPLTDVFNDLKVGKKIQ